MIKLVSENRCIMGSYSDHMIWAGSQKVSSHFMLLCYLGEQLCNPQPAVASFMLLCLLGDQLHNSQPALILCCSAYWGISCIIFNQL